MMTHFYRHNRAYVATPQFRRIVTVKMGESLINYTLNICPEMGSFEILIVSWDGIRMYPLFFSIAGPIFDCICSHDSNSIPTIVRFSQINWCFADSERWNFHLYVLVVLRSIIQ